MTTLVLSFYNRSYSFLQIRQDPITSYGVSCPEGGGGGGTLIFSSYVGSGQASTVHPEKISGISSTPKNI